LLIYLSPYSFGRKQQHSNNGVVIRHSGGGCNIRSPYSGLSNAIVIRSQYWYRLTLNRKLPDSVMIEYVVDMMAIKKFSSTTLNKKTKKRTIIM